MADFLLTSIKCLFFETRDYVLQAQESEDGSSRASAQGSNSGDGANGIRGPEVRV